MTHRLPCVHTIRAEQYYASQEVPGVCEDCEHPCDDIGNPDGPHCEKGE